MECPQEGCQKAENVDAASEDDVRAHLNQGGKVESFRMVFDKETMQPKGYGFCDFADSETAVAAIKVLSERECHGRLLRLDLAGFGMTRAPERQPDAPLAAIKTSQQCSCFCEICIAVLRHILRNLVMLGGQGGEPQAKKLQNRSHIVPES